jgi:YVTN family beta-propeller protein
VAGAVYRIDPQTNAVVATVKIPGVAACGIAATETAVWVGRCKFGDTGLVRIDPATNAIAATIAGPQACGVAVDDDAVWVSDVRNNSIWRIDPASNAVVAKIALAENTLPCGPVVAAYGSVWVTGVGNGTVSRIDPATNTVMATIHVGASNGPNLEALRGPESMTAGGGFVWIGNDVDEKLYRINPLDNHVTRFDVGATDQGFWRGFSVSFGMGSLWARTGICEAAQVDPATGTVIKRVSLCNPIYDQTGNIMAAFDSLWVAYPESGRIQRIQP